MNIRQARFQLIERFVTTLFLSLFLATGSIDAYAQSQAIEGNDKQPPAFTRMEDYPLARDHENEFNHYVYKGPKGAPTGWISLTAKPGGFSHLYVYLDHPYGKKMGLAQIGDIEGGQTKQYEVAAGVHQIMVNPSPDLNPGSEEYDVIVKPGATVKLTAYKVHHGPTAAFKDTTYLFSHPKSGNYPFRLESINGSQDLTVTSSVRNSSSAKGN
jgi:hypothetical protein